MGQDVEELRSKYKHSLQHLKRIRDYEIKIERSVIDIIGEGALRIFLRDVDGYLFSDSVLEQAVVHADSDEVSEEEEARMNLLFIEYLKQFVQGRVDGVKKNIVNSLGEEAYYRICHYGELYLED